MSPQAAPFGTWKSPITPQTLTERTVNLSQLRQDGPDLYWVEDNPRREGRSVLLRRDALAQTREALPMLEGSRLVNVSTKVHDRGGRAYTVKDGDVVVSDGFDNRVYYFRVADRKRELRPLTQLDDRRYGDFWVDAPRGVVYAVLEEPAPDGHPDAEPLNSLVTIPLDGSAVRDPNQIKTVFSGTDFVSSPTISPDGSKLAWLTWNQPEMPWTKSELHVGNLDDSGALVNDVVIVDRPDVCAYEPRWTLDGDLVHVDDSTGWANFYRTEGFKTREGEPEDAWCTRLRTRALHPGPRAFSKPHWKLGLHSYDNYDHEHLVTAWAEGAQWHIGTIRLDNGLLEEWDLGWEPVGNVATAGDRVVFLGSSPTEGQAVIEVVDGKVNVIRASSESEVEGEYVSVAEHVEWANRDGSVSRGLYYPPKSDDYIGMPNTAPPLLVTTHRVPTDSARDGMNPAVQFWTTRGFGVFRPNPRGSTGRGREYREALNGAWGTLDVQDIEDGVRFLIDAGKADPDRVAIRGVSFGGFTALSALEKTDVFSAGALLSGIADIREFMRTTSKFEKHYPARLLGVESPDDPKVEQFSVLAHLDKIQVPVLFLHGSNDRLISVRQVEDAYDRLVELGRPAALKVFPEEGHVFHLDRNVMEALRVELSFYGKVWGFPVDDEVPVEIANWS